jgi:2-C-methyl-D-erythritol 2,4-cyclodiphosphate synthase
LKIKTGIGQDSHAFDSENSKPLILGGIEFNHPQGLKGNSDADVILHSITISDALLTKFICFSTKNILTCY